MGRHYVFIALIFAVATSISNAFTSLSPPGSRTLAPYTSLSMVIGPKQMLAMEKRKNPEKFESTIQGLMTTKKLTRNQAEQVRELICILKLRIDPKYNCLCHELVHLFCFSNSF